jgi:hypothetical protein
LLAFVLSLVAPALAAEARPPGEFRLSWIAPAGCPSGADVEADARRLVGATTNAQRLVARGKLVRLAPHQWQLNLVTALDESRGQRQLTFDSCEAAAQAAAVVLALMLNPHASVEAEPTTAVTASHPPPARGSLEAALRGGAAFGVFPGASPRLSVGLSGGLGPARLWLRASAGLIQTIQASSDNPAGARLHESSIGAAFCWEFLAASVGVAPCAGVDLHRVVGRGRGVSQPEDGEIGWAAGSLGLLGGVPLGSVVGVQVLLAAEVPFARPRVYLQDIGELLRPFVIGGRADLGLVFKVW